MSLKLQEITLYVCSVHRGVFSSSGGYHEYIGRCSVHVGDIMIHGGYDDTWGNMMIHGGRDIMIHGRREIS